MVKICHDHSISTSHTKCRRVQLNDQHFHRLFCKFYPHHRLVDCKQFSCLFARNLSALFLWRKTCESHFQALLQTVLACQHLTFMAHCFRSYRLMNYSTRRNCYRALGPFIPLNLPFHYLPTQTSQTNLCCNFGCFGQTSPYRSKISLTTQFHGHRSFFLHLLFLMLTC